MIPGEPTADTDSPRDPSAAAASSAEQSTLASLLRTRRRWGGIFAALVRSTGMGIFAVDAAGRFVLFNPECERLTGWRQDDVFAAAEAPSEPERVPVELLRPEAGLLEPGRPATTNQVHLPVAGGARRWFEINWVPVAGADSTAELVVGFLRDIDEQRLLQTHMARLEKLAALGELTASIAHEVRNPLAAMKLGLNALADELEAGHSAAEIIHEVSAEVNRLDRVVSRLLDFARVKESEFQETDLRALLERTLGYVRNQAEGRGIALSCDVDPAVVAIRCDPDQIQQVLLNVILNAFHAMKTGGALHIHIDRLTDLRLPSGEPGPAARIRVTDRGVGIPAHLLHKVFDPFFSTRPGGTGLGLSVSFHLVSRHGGDIDIESEIGKGTTVKILLPEAGPSGARRVAERRFDTLPPS